MDSEEGRGSTFWFTARLHLQAEPVDLWRPAPGVRVLLLGLPGDFEDLTEAQFRAWGIPTHILPPSLEAVEVLKSLTVSPDTPLLIHLGDEPKSMLDLLTRIRTEPTLRSLRMVLLHSLYTPQPSGAAGLAFTETLSLPFRKSHLKSLLDRRPSEDHEPSALTPSGTVEALPANRPWRILLAEDNPVNQRVALTILKKLGIVADLAHNGMEAVDAITSKPYDLVLMDCQMPVLDGFQATRTVREWEAGKQRVPIVAMTANAMAGDRDRCLEAGMDDYLAKPVTIEALRNHLIRWLVSEPTATRAPE